MNNNPLEIPLRDIHLPEPIFWWPVANSVWITLGCVFLLALFLGFVIRTLLKSTLKREAYKALATIEKLYHEHQDPRQCLSELSVFLRRVVLSQNHSVNCAGLTGQAWLELLDQPLKKPEFSQGVGQILLKGPYQPQVEKEDADQLLHLCQRWVSCL